MGVICCSSEKHDDCRDNGTRQEEETKVPCDKLRSQKLLFSIRDANVFLVDICSVVTPAACLAASKIGNERQKITFYARNSHLKNICSLILSVE